MQRPLLGARDSLALPLKGDGFFPRKIRKGYAREEPFGRGEIELANDAERFASPAVHDGCVRIESSVPPSPTVTDETSRTDFANPGEQSIAAFIPRIDFGAFSFENREIAARNAVTVGKPATLLEKNRVRVGDKKSRHDVLVFRPRIGACRIDETPPRG